MIIILKDTKENQGNVVGILDDSRYSRYSDGAYIEYGRYDDRRDAWVQVGHGYAYTLDELCDYARYGGNDDIDTETWHDMDTADMDIYTVA